MVRIGESDNHYYDDYKRDNPPTGSAKSTGDTVNVQDEYRKYRDDIRAKYTKMQEDAIAKYNKMKEETNANYESFRQQANADYESFRQQANADYENFVNQAHEEYENFANPDNEKNPVQDERAAANARYVEEMRKPWKEYKMAEPIPIPELEDNHPIIINPDAERSEAKPVQFTPNVKVTGIRDPFTLDEMLPPGETPEEMPIDSIDGVKVQREDKSGGSQLIEAEEPVIPKAITGPPRGTNPEYDKMVLGENAVDDSTPAEPTPQKVDNSQQKIQKQIIQRDDGIVGIYAITPDESGNGFRVIKQMSVSVIKNKEYNKYFKVSLIGENKIEPDAQGYYNYRGIKSDNYNVFSRMLLSQGQSTLINNAIYDDLVSKQKSGTKLTDAEKNFMQFHLKNLESMGLGRDSNGKLYDLSE